VLDATLGVPARGLPIVLHRLCPGSNGIWEAISCGSTNEDGRIPDLLPAHSLTEGRYKMWFDTGVYLRACHAAHPAVFAPEPFYPEASVEFYIAAGVVRTCCRRHARPVWVCIERAALKAWHGCITSVTASHGVTGCPIRVPLPSCL
jgi:5-hydroxyisourate hydrolase